MITELQSVAQDKSREIVLGAYVCNFERAECRPLQRVPQGRWDQRVGRALIVPIMPWRSAKQTAPRPW